MPEKEENQEQKPTFQQFVESFSKDHQSNPVFADIKDFEGLGTRISENYNSVQKIGNPDKIASVPEENAPDEEIAKYLNKLPGVPKTEDQYSLERPSDYPEEMYDTSHEQAFKKIAKTMSLTNKQAKELWSHSINTKLLESRKTEEIKKAEKENHLTKLRTVWKGDFEKNIANANAALKLTGKSMSDMLTKDGEISDPKFIEGFANIGKLLTSDQIGVEAKNTAMTKEQAAAKIKQIRTDPKSLFNNGDKNAISEMEKLYQIK
jgi:hypothetical protein